MRATSALLFLTIPVVACGPLLPPDLPRRALVRDVQRVVDVRSRLGWFVDESELVIALPYAMQSACQVSADTRTSSLGWMDGAITSEGGTDLRRVFEERGRKTSRMTGLTRLVRARLVLARADEWARQGRCPFWLEEEPQFDGVHTQDSRFILTLEGGGRVSGELALDKVRVGGGGSGRVLGGYGFAEGWAFSVGLEGGASARFTDLRIGEQSELPQIVGQVTAPLVLRWQFGVTAHAEIETGAMAYISQAVVDPNTGEVDVQFDWGLHAGFAVGGTYLRLQRGVIPKFAVVVTVDHVPTVGGRPALTQLGVGLRTGIDISRWQKY